MTYNTCFVYDLFFFRKIYLLCYLRLVYTHIYIVYSTDQSRSSITGVFFRFLRVRKKVVEKMNAHMNRPVYVVRFLRDPLMEEGKTNVAAA